MRLIAHRGNLNGPNLDRENSPDYIDAALSEGFDAEIDLWISNSKPALGHDSPEYPVSWHWLLTREDRLWIHCKSFEALVQADRRGFHAFFHHEDALAITTRRFFWCHPSTPFFSKRSVILDFELSRQDWVSKSRDCFAVCTDNPIEFSQLFPPYTEGLGH